MKPCIFAMSCLAGMVLSVPVPPAAGVFALADDRPADPARFVVFTAITTTTDRGSEGYLFDRFNNKATRLQLAPGADTFQVKTTEGMVTVSGRVVRISLGEREMVFQAGDRYYAVHLGQTLEDALRKPLSKERMKELKLPPPR